MKKKYPIRHKTHTQEELSERYFVSCMPPNWTAFKPPNDYGIDLHVDIFEGTSATGLELLIQLKASQIGSHNETEIVSLKVSTYNYLKDKLQVVMLVKYIEAENEAFWLLLKDVPEPNQAQATFTVYIPKTNKLSKINWDEIYNHILQVTDEKLAARRIKEQESRLLSAQNNFQNIGSAKITQRRSAKEIAQRKASINRYKSKKEEFYFSIDGVKRAEQEAENLFEKFKGLVDEIRNPESGLYFKVERKDDGLSRILEITSRNLILRIEWFNRIRNSLDISGLGLWLTKNFRHFGDYGEKGEIISEGKYYSNIDMNNNIGWSVSRESSTIIASSELVDTWVGKLIEALE